MDKVRKVRKYHLSCLGDSGYEARVVVGLVNLVTTIYQLSSKGSKAQNVSSIYISIIYQESRLINRREPRVMRLNLKLAECYPYFPPFSRLKSEVRNTTTKLRTQRQKPLHMTRLKTARTS